MARKASRSHGLTVAVTGASGSFGSLLLPLLQADPRVERILTLGPKPPLQDADASKVTFVEVDLSRPDAEAQLSSLLEGTPVDAFYHLAFLYAPVRDAGHAHEVEVIGTMRVLSAAAKGKVPRLILPSLTMLYGARGDSPALLTEQASLEGCPQSRFVNDKVQVEQAIEQFRHRHPDIHVIVLRFAPVLGRRVDNPATRLLKRRLVPTLLGFDPLWQGVHEDDAARAMHMALTTEASGVFNVVADGVLPFSGLVREAGGQPLPLPTPIARAALRTLNGVGVTAVPVGLLDYFHYSWVADGVRARTELGFVCQRDVREAAASLKGS